MRGFKEGLFKTETEEGPLDLEAWGSLVNLRRRLGNSSQLLLISQRKIR